MSLPGPATPPVEGRGVRLVSVAGFLPDLRAGLARHGLGITLGDEVPFTEYFDGVDRGELLGLAPVAAELTGAAAAVDGPGRSVDGLPPTLEAVILPRQTVAILARIDDTRLRVLWTTWWSAVVVGRDGPAAGVTEPSPELTQAVRGLVVQARAAVANGWVVVVAAAA